MTPTIEIPVPTSEECVRASLELLREAEGLRGDRGGMGSSARAQSEVLVAKAQVWATLATAPQPLEAIASAALDSFQFGNTEPFSRTRLVEEAFRHLPAAVCPHGYTAKASLIREPDQEPRIVLTWHGDGGCMQGCP